MVYETTSAGPQPISGVLLIRSTPSAGPYAYQHFVGADGRYSVTLDTGVFVTVGARVSIGRHQPCVASTTMQVDRILDVEFSRVGVRSANDSPRVSGHITQNGQPLVDRRVLYYFFNHLVAHTYTDANGRYEFCRVPVGTGMIAVVDPDVNTGGTLEERTVLVNGDLVSDFAIPIGFSPTQWW